MPRVFRFKCQFKCKKCGKSVSKMGSCQPAECKGCGAKKGRFELTKKVDLKSK